MNLFINSELSIATWVLAFSSAFIIGVSKSGIKGIAIIIVTLMALAFGAKENRHTQWKYILRFLPWMMFGVLIGVAIGKDLDENTFKTGMAFVIIGSVLMMYWWDRKKSKNVPKHWAFAGSMGIMAGITTMIGNLAGAFSNIFFLAMRLPKNEFIGTAAWLFFIINIFKLPFHIFVWETITVESVVLNIKLIPGILIGLLTGIQLVKYIKDDFYRKMILVLTAFGAIMILLK